MRSDKKKLLNFWLAVLCLGLIAATPTYLSTDGGTVGGTDALPRGCVDLNATLPGGLGAACTGDGTTDDTACFLAHVEYANSNPYQSTTNGISKACVHVSGGSATSPKRYLIKSPTNMCAIIGKPNATCPAYNHGMTLAGDGKDVSRLIPDLSSAGPFLDFGSGSYNSVHDLTIEDVTGDATTIAVVFSEGNQTASSDNNRLYHATIRLQNGSNPQNIGALFCRTDISGPGDDVDIVTQGTALVQGNGGGPAYANGFTSPFYTLFDGYGYCTGGDADTHQYLGSNSNYGSLNSQTIALTGSDEYDMGGNVYASLNGNTTTVPGVMTIGYTGRERSYLFFNGLRIEDHGTHTGTLPAAIWFTTLISGGHIDGALTTGNGGAILGGTSAGTLSGLTVNAYVGVTGSTFSFFNLGSYIYASHFLLGLTDSTSGGITMGTSTGSLDSEIKTNLLTTAQIIAGLGNYRQTQVCGSDGCKKTSEDWFPILVSQLPGGAFPGNTWVVGDATTASAQGQVCAGTGTIGGSGTVYAKAFWNGTSWICSGYPLSAPAQVPIRAGTWTITNPASSTAVSFATPMTIAPDSCTISWSASVISVGVPWVSTFSTAGLTVNVVTTPTSTFSGSYFCGNNNAH